MNKITRKVVVLATFFAGFPGLILGKTFMTIHPPFVSGTPERETFTRILGQDQASFIQLVPLGGQSRLPERIAQYFLPFHKSSLLVASDTVGAELRDLSPEPFNVKTQNNEFQSQCLFSAQYSFYGVGFAWRQEYIKDFWVEVGFPILHVATEFNIDETSINKGGGAADGIGLENVPYVGSMEEAFQQPQWSYGRIENKKKHVREGISDIELKFGWRYHELPGVDMNAYVGLIFPTSNAPTSEFMFEPMLGNNKHWGLMFGSHSEINLYCKTDQQLNFVFDLNTRYLMANDEIRSFDIREKDFSRYISIYSSPQQAVLAAAKNSTGMGSFGIRTFTQNVNVDPGFSVTFISAFRYNVKRWEFELGYNFFTRQMETLRINWEKSPAVRDVGGLGYTNRARTMNQNFGGAASQPSDYIPLDVRDLDLVSASHPANISYTFYGVLGYHLTEGCYPTQLGLGGSYEVTGGNGVNRWMTWLKLEMGF